MYGTHQGRGSDGDIIPVSQFRSPGPEDGTSACQTNGRAQRNLARAHLECDGDVSRPRPVTQAYEYECSAISCDMSNQGPVPVQAREWISSIVLHLKDGLGSALGRYASVWASRCIMPPQQTGKPPTRPILIRGYEDGIPSDSYHL